MFSIPLGPFELQSPIGKGGMGEVWRGIHRGQKVPVAIKVMTGARARQRRYRESFLNEVRAVATLSHPGVVMIFDYGTIPAEAEELSSRRLVARSPYLVMELASRGSLDQVRGIIPWNDLKRFLISLLDALAHAHARGVVHRDLKPGNILICAASDLRPGLKLTDFGLAHAREEMAGRSGIRESKAGTPRYMAPELFEGHWRDYGPWTDLYALGCMAYEMCSNRPMFDGKDYQALKRQHTYQPPGTLRSLQPVPAEFEAWLMRLVAKKTHERFQCAADAAWALMRMDLDQNAAAKLRAMNLEGPVFGGGSETTMMSNMSGLGEVSTFFFPDLPWDWSVSGSTLLQAEGRNDIYQAATHMLMDHSISDAATYMFPDYELAGAHTYLFSGGVEQGDRVRHPASSEGIEQADDPIERVAAPIPPTWRHAAPAPPSMKLVGAGLRLFELRILRLAGREQQRDDIWKLLSEVRQTGTARLALLHGPAGVGKSRLARWLCERALEVGAGWALRAVHSPMSGPTDGLSSMLARHLGVVGMRRPDIRRRTRRILQEQGVQDAYEWDALTEMLASNLEEGVSARVRPIHFANPTERYVLIRRLLARLGEERPMVMWLDDIQWGSDTLAFVEYLMRSQSVAPTPVLIVLTARDEALVERPTERQMVDKLMQFPNAHSIGLSSLNDEEMSSLVEELLGLSPPLARRVKNRTQGNPLFAVQLVGDWVSRGVLEVTEAGFVLKDGEKADLPDDIHQVWSRRVMRLLDDEDDSAMLALEMAAVLGQEVDALEWEDACKMAGIRLSFHLLYKLISARLAQPADDVWTFAHGMLRESLERNVKDAGRWRSHNRACAQMLRKRYPSRPKGISERLGRHLMEAGDYAAALNPLLQGAQERLDGSEYRIAHSLISTRDEALAALDIDEADPNYGLGWLSEIDICRREGHIDEAVLLVEKAVKSAEKYGWSNVLPRAQELLGHVYVLTGNLDGARNGYIKARKAYEENDNAKGIVDCQRGLGQVAFQRGDLGRATELLHHALITSKRFEDKRRVAECLQATCTVVIQRGDLVLAVDLNRRAMELHKITGNIHGVAECRREEARIAVLQGELDQGTDLYEEALQLFERLGTIHGITSSLRGLAEIALLRGWFDTARDGYERVLVLNEATGYGNSVLPRLELGWVLFKEGNTEAAVEMFEECHKIARKEEMRTVLAAVHAHMVAGAALKGDWLAWWEHMRTLEELIKETESVDVHIAVPVQAAGDLAVEAEQENEAQQAYALARAQWKVLGRSDRIAEIDASLEKLAAMLVDV